MEQTLAKASELSPEDKTRMRRLHEEIMGRYMEMALIMGRALGNPNIPSHVAVPGSQIVLRYKIRNQDQKSIAQAQARAEDQYYCVEINGGHWEDPPGICAMGGCP